MIRAFEKSDITSAMKIWNDAVSSGEFIYSDKLLDEVGFARMCETQTAVAVAEIDGIVAGLYILHPNHEGRGGHIANASYVVDENFRGQGIGKALISDSIKKAKQHGFKGFQFNAVVATNPAISLYKKLGFKETGKNKKAFKLPNGKLVDTIIMFLDLE